MSPYTEDYDTALEWFTALAPAGVEGLVAKGAATRYRPGRAGIVGEGQAPQPDRWDRRRGDRSGEPGLRRSWSAATRPRACCRIVGRSTALTSQQAKELAAVLTEVPGSDHPWPAEIGGGHFGGGKVAITHVDPVLVVEVAADTALQAGRHGTPSDFSASGPTWPQQTSPWPETLGTMDLPSPGRSRPGGAGGEHLPQGGLLGDIDAQLVARLDDHVPGGIAALADLGRPPTGSVEAPLSSC